MTSKTRTASRQGYYAIMYPKDVNVFYSADDARKFAFSLINRRLRKSVTIYYEGRNFGSVYCLGYGVVFKDGYGKKYVIGPDGTIYREYDGTW